MSASKELQEELTPQPVSISRRKNMVYVSKAPLSYINALGPHEANKMFNVQGTCRKCLAKKS